jgi:hypothetical protein
MAGDVSSSAGREAATKQKGRREAGLLRKGFPSISGATWARVCDAAGGLAACGAVDRLRGGAVECHRTSRSFGPPGNIRGERGKCARSNQADRNAKKPFHLSLFLISTSDCRWRFHHPIGPNHLFEVGLAEQANPRESRERSKRKPREGREKARGMRLRRQSLFFGYLGYMNRQTKRPARGRPFREEYRLSIRSVPCHHGAAEGVVHADGAHVDVLPNVVDTAETRERRGTSR